jgi:hypothetical protein
MAGRVKKRAINLPTSKIVSGDQTGAARACLDWATKNGVLHGGWRLVTPAIEHEPNRIVFECLSL